MSGSISGVKISINWAPAQAGIIDIHQEWINASSWSATKPDPKWVHVDQLGHFHAWDDDGKLPTLDIKTRRIEFEPAVESEDDGRAAYDDDEADGYDERFYACRICGDEIEPKYVPDYRDKVIPGRVSWTVKVDAALTRGAEVSVVVETEDRTSFGVGTVLNCVAPFGEGYIRSTIVGTGPLAVRTKPSAPKPRRHDRD